MNRKIRVGILFGGQSAEHEISLLSAKNIIDAIDRRKYEVVLIGIDKRGGWHLQPPDGFLLNEANPEFICLNASSEELAIVPEKDEQKFLSLSSQQPIGQIDVVFPVLHGPYGEDGTVQGLLKMADIPFVGAGVVGAAVGMDKDVMKRLLRDAGIPIAAFFTVTAGSRNKLAFQEVKTTLGLPCFVKPANLGSSVGISKAHDEEEFERALDIAFQYDRKVLLEEYIEGREIECSVLGNDDPIASVPGEIVTDSHKHQFYSYEAKYLDEHGAALHIPAQLPDHLIQKIQSLSVRTFQTLCCEGMARIDCFLTGDERVVINEINTIPGFTKISMYPKLWEASGISPADLIERLLQLALERHQQEKTLATALEK